MMIMVGHKKKKKNFTQVTKKQSDGKKWSVLKITAKQKLFS